MLTIPKISNPMNHNISQKVKNKEIVLHAPIPHTVVVNVLT